MKIIKDCASYIDLLFNTNEPEKYVERTGEDPKLHSRFTYRCWDR